MTERAIPSVWAQAMAQLAAAGDRLTAEMCARGESADNTDVYATFLGALMDAYLFQLSGDPDHPSFLPTAGFFQRTGSPNPDTVYRRAPVDGAGTYRLTGERGTAPDVTLMPFDAAMRSSRPFDLSDVARGPDGSFDVVLSAERPAGHTGDWWPLAPEVTSVWLRAVSDRWGEDREPRIAITRVDSPSSRPRPEGADLNKRLAALAPTVERIVEYGLRRSDELADEGYVNALKLVDYRTRGGMPQQWYHEGLFELADDEALLVEAEMPAGWTYFSWSLTDRMLVTLDWVHAQTSLNRSQATVDADGMLRVVVSATDPGVRNWMDTTGYRTGVLQCRTAGSQEPPAIAARVVSIRSLDEHLAADTERLGPAERADELRTRKVGAQLRHLW
jgi:Protein of unknown function (DUF1214)